MKGKPEKKPKSKDKMLKKHLWLRGRKLPCLYCLRLVAFGELLAQELVSALLLDVHASLKYGAAM